ncbi:MAG: GIY-YIG nuclease family protein [Nitrospiraceae bacterium]|nr:MAG: GIY-YIG nuclease family protein [Nitrospiraceae bacterium]
MMYKVTQSIKDTHVLILDIQATGADPGVNHILEIGWSTIGTGCNGSAPRIRSSCVKLPDDAEVSRRVLKITGLSDDDFENGLRLPAVWKRVMRSAKNINKTNGTDTCPLVIHYSRFEEPYLRLLHEQYNGGGLFPFRIVCTHEISKRLFPELPRKGLRAIAGYLGYSTDQMRRASHHTAATAFIWQTIIPVLKKTYDIRSMEDLIAWMADTGRSISKSRAYPMKDAQRKNIPARPGIYRMRRLNGDVLYVGKAASLKQRVRSYFQKKTGHAEHILEMLSQAQDLDYTLTLSTLEAAMLESDMIKALSPPYNMSLKQGSRDVCFYTQGLDACNSGPTRKYCTGPVPSNDLFDCLHYLKSLLKTEKTDISSAESFLVPGLPAEYQPDHDTFAEGLAIFRDTYKTYLSGDVEISTLLHIGALVWREKLKNREEEEAADLSDEESDKEEDNREEQFVWTPERTAKALESVLSRSSFLLRRARWFCMLSESSISWKPGNGSSSEKMLMIIHNGTIKKHASVPVHQATPVPPGYCKGFPVRRRNFNLAVYDRMRVLTTEIRRLIKEDRLLELCLGPQGRIKKDSLSRFLRWV